jgi:hypothetical protein
MLIPRIAFAEQTAAVGDRGIVDVALGEGGVFTGQVVDSQNLGVQFTEVVLLRNGQEVARTRTDIEGRFAVGGLRGGVYIVSSHQGVGVFRLWSPRTAPPTAESTGMLVTGNLARGNMGGGGFLYMISNPWVIAGLVAVAIALPLAIDNGSTS